SSDGVTIEGNYLGIDAIGNKALLSVDNNGSDILANTDTHLNILNNVISGGAYFGIDLYPNDDHVTIQGNLIGTNATGTAALGNTNGIYMIFNVQDVLIGGIDPAARNVISGNFGSGVTIASNGVDPDCNNITLQGNYIGTNISGEEALPNLADGISVGG